MVIYISKGEDFGRRKCGRPWRTLYVDGKMTLKSMQDRLLLLDSDPMDDLYPISHDDLAGQKSSSICAGNTSRSGCLRVALRTG
jgi:hypothetical protein